jgi:nucleotide-binding universal stress UspA family protein
MTHQAAVLVGLGDANHGVPELDWGAREAQARGAAVRIVRAYTLSPGTLPWEPMSDRIIKAEMRQDAQRRLHAALAHLRECRPDVEAGGEVIDGVPWEVLRKAAADASITVLGSRHHGAFGSVLPGSVSTVVAASAPGPVVIAVSTPVNPATDPAVIVGVDGSERTEEVLDFAFGYASRHRRRLLAIFCWHPDLLAGMHWGRHSPARERAERWLGEALAGWQEKYPEVPVHRSVVRDFPVSGLVAASRSQELLVVGGRSRHARIAALLGSVSQGVLHQATCPVAVVHPRAADSV